MELLEGKDFKTIFMSFFENAVSPDEGFIRCSTQRLVAGVFKIKSDCSFCEIYLVLIIMKFC